MRSAAVILVLAAADAVHAGATFIGGPTYDLAAATGYNNVNIRNPAIGGGWGVVTADSYSGGAYVGMKALHWGTSGSSAELGNLGGGTEVRSINTSGVSVGSAGIPSGDQRAVRWDASGNATQLGVLGTNSSGQAYGEAYSINHAGTVVGVTDKWDGDTWLGEVAVRWEAGSTVATEFAHEDLVTTNVYATTKAYVISDSGIVVGSGTNDYLNTPLRWNAEGKLTELGMLATSTSCQATLVNYAGTAAGGADKYDDTGSVYQGMRAVRWGDSTTAATELGNLGVDGTGETTTAVTGINSAGTIVGHAKKYVGDVYVGYRAVRWDATGTAATELGNLGTDLFGASDSDALGINDAGIIVGQAILYVGGLDSGYRAVMWGPDGVAVDLNTLLPADSGWTLMLASGISNDNWVIGAGLFDPDGAGPLDAYDRAFMLQVPEPGSLLLLATGCGMSLLTMRRRTLAH